MYGLHPEIGISQLSKFNEELCGDNVEVVKTPSHTIIVLSDGLGSGVKANILSTLTTKIASSMLRRGIPLVDVVETIAQTLPVCKQRKIAYSTMHIIKIAKDGSTTVVESDCPRTLLIRKGNVVPFPAQEKEVAGKTFIVGNLILQEEDILVAVSDGVIHAGIGGLLKLGWGWDGLAHHLLMQAEPKKKPKQICEEIINICDGFYIGKPGDDCTVVTTKMRKPVQITLFTGPPINSAIDDKIVRRFLSKEGLKVVAGGTTANIVSRVTGRPLKVEMEYPNRNIPPIGHIEGIDLVTEGLLTLNAVADKLKDKTYNVSEQKTLDGATMLAGLLIEADIIDIIVGGAVNPAHQNPNFPININLRSQVIEKLKTALIERGKIVSMECC